MTMHILHIGKTGGTAIGWAIEPYRASSAHPVILHPHGVRLVDIPCGESVIFFLRDPISRFVSGFYSRQRRGQPRYLSPWSLEEEAAFATFSTPNQLAMALSSPILEERAAAQQAMRHIQHVRSHYWDWFQDREYFRSRLADIAFIGFQERLAADFEVLKRKLGLPDHATLPSDDVQAHRNPTHVDRRLEDGAIANLTQWYRSDFEFVALCQTLLQMHPTLGGRPAELSQA
ncbi:MAG: sulfotransferase family 2 domain-containing protein [Kaiparowitsia implicata GSE-PSE-MK54-09C]|jgi:hypothetical protein|nr:sulfotransferase family 2 domain-containing protein [Kaiparowitsia implicata GSE-PSE-MK54-09C]